MVGKAASVVEGCTKEERERERNRSTGTKVFGQKPATKRDREKLSPGE